MLLKNLFEKIKDNESTFLYLKEINIIEDFRCPKCRRLMNISFDKRRYGCGKKNCQKKLASLKSTFFRIFIMRFKVYYY